jgi:hypothetical protein
MDKLVIASSFNKYFNIFWQLAISSSKYIGHFNFHLEGLDHRCKHVYPSRTHKACNINIDIKAG